MTSPLKFVLCLALSGSVYAQTPAAPATQYGPIDKQESLWSIASKLRPSNEVTVQQTIGAIYALNEQHFEAKNIHGLVYGVKLTVPTLAQVQAQNDLEVKKRLINQKRAWIQYRTAQGNSTESISTVPAMSSGELTPKPAPVTEPAPATGNATAPQAAEKPATVTPPQASATPSDHDALLTQAQQLLEKNPDEAAKLLNQVIDQGDYAQVKKAMDIMGQLNANYY